MFSNGGNERNDNIGRSFDGAGGLGGVPESPRPPPLPPLPDDAPFFRGGGSLTRNLSPGFSPLGTTTRSRSPIGQEKVSTVPGPTPSGTVATRGGLSCRSLAAAAAAIIAALRGDVGVSPRFLNLGEFGELPALLFGFNGDLPPCICNPRLSASPFSAISAGEESPPGALSLGMETRTM